MEKLYEIRNTFIILLVGLFFVSGCFFERKYEVTFKTNGGSKIESITLKSGSTLEDVKEPTKEGYKFKGWYVDNKEFDFDTKIEKDITLVAKWEKIEIDYEENSKDEDLDMDIEIPKEDDEETTKKTTTKKKKTTKKNTTSKKATTKKTTSTKPIVIDTTTITTSTSTTTTTESTTTETTSTSELVTVQTTTSTSTTTTTSNPVNVTTISTSALIPDIEHTTVTTTQVVKMNIVKVNDSVTEVNPDTLEEETKIVENIKITFDVEDEFSNVESNISVEDFNILKNSDRKLWVINNEYGLVYENIYDLTEDEVEDFTLRGDENKVYALSVFDGYNNYVFEYDELLNKWFIKYPGVSLGTGLALRYYKDIDTALKLAKHGDTITLISDLVIDNRIVIDKFINIDFNNKNITSNADYLLEFKDLNDETQLISIKNYNGLVNSFMYINEGILLDKILVEGSNITYNNIFKNNDVNVSVSLVNTSLSGIL